MNKQCVMKNNLLKGLKLERLENSDIIIARKEIVIPNGKAFFFSRMPVWLAGQVENNANKSRGGFL